MQKYACITHNDGIGKLQVGIFHEGRAFLPKMSLNFLLEIHTEQGWK